jgi:hypothetical protein
MSVMKSDGGEQAGDGGVFLSYSSGDRALILEIQSFLQGRQIATFLDRNDLLPGRQWIDALQTAIDRASAVVVFVGSDGLGVWQKREVALALDRQAGLEKTRLELPVVPVLLPGAELEDAPGILRLNTWIDLRRGLGDAEALDGLVRAVTGGVVPATERATAVPLCPYRGLYAFREEDVSLFCGRDAFSTQLLDKVRANTVVAVVGSSGVGKSSVVQAGLIPRLRRERPPHPTWDAITFKPGSAPFHQLAAALVSTWSTNADAGTQILRSEEVGAALSDGKARIEAFIPKALEATRADRLLIVVDQFEELFTLTPEPLRQRFVEAILASAETAPVAVVFTLRADFYNSALTISRTLSDRLQQAQVNLGPMMRAELGEAIERPATATGLSFESGLTERILDNVESQPGNLPLLEFALTELWNGRVGRLLTNACYDRMGGVAGSIGARASEVLSSLPAPGKVAARRVLCRLVRVTDANEEGVDSRRRVRLSDLDGAARSVVQAFAAPGARLLVTSRDAVTGEETVEVAHEALLQSWPQLSEWLGADRAFLLWRQRLGSRVGEYERTARDTGTLLRGAMLVEAIGYVKTRAGDLSVTELEFIRSSRAELRAPWRLTAATVLAVIVLVGGGYVAQSAWKKTDQYQSSRMVEDALILAPQAKTWSRRDWADALALSGRTDEARRFVSVLDSRFDTVIARAAIAQRMAQRGDLNGSYTLLTAAATDARRLDVGELLSSYLRFLGGVRALIAHGGSRLAISALDSMSREDIPAVTTSGNSGCWVGDQMAELYQLAGSREASRSLLLRLASRTAADSADWSCRVTLTRQLAFHGDKPTAERLVAEAERLVRAGTGTARAPIADVAYKFLSVADAYGALGDADRQQVMVVAALGIARDRRVIWPQPNTNDFEPFYYVGAQAFAASLAKSGRAKEVDEFIGGLDASARVHSLSAVASVLRETNLARARRYVSDAEQMIPEIEYDNARAAAGTALARESALVGDTARAGRLLDKALDVARHMSEEDSGGLLENHIANKTERLAGISIGLCRIGRAAEARVVAGDAERMSRRISGDAAGQLRAVSIALAAADEYALARQTAARIGDLDDRLSVLAAVFVEVARRHDPKVARMITEAPE